jgi:hypothetical protein
MVLGVMIEIEFDYRWNFWQRFPWGKACLEGE